MTDINKIKSFQEKHYYAIIIFAFIMIYSCIIPGEFKSFGVSGAVKAIHAVDFGMGFCSKLLPGAIYNLFFDSVGTVKTSIYLAVLLVLFFAVLSFLLEKFILKVDPCHRKTALIILAFFLTGPSTFAIHVYYPGMLDMYWVFCALMFFVFLTKKQFTPLVFFPFVLCITIYFASLICFIPFFVIILLYKISCTEGKKERGMLWTVLVVSVTVTVGLSVYLAVFESDNLIYTIEEFHEIYSKKGIDNFFYFDQSLYKYDDTYGYEDYAVFTLKGDSAIKKIIWEIALRINYNLSKMALHNKLIIFSLILPVVAMIYAFMFNQIKLNIKSNHKLKSFSYICTLILPFFTLFTSVFFSEDLVRWIGHAFLTLFASFIFVICNEGKASWEWIEDKLAKIPSVPLMLFFSLYATTVYHPYYTG